MSFRKKARAVITPSIIARSRPRAAGTCSEATTNDDGNRSLRNIKNETCDDVSGPKAASYERKHVEDGSKNVAQEPRDGSASNSPSTSTPSTPILGKRFKRARPTPILSGRSVQNKEGKPTEDNGKVKTEMPSIIEHNSSNSFMANEAKESDTDSIRNTVTDTSLDQLQDDKIKQESDNHSGSPLNNKQEFEAADNRHGALDCSLPNDDEMYSNSQIEVVSNTVQRSSEKVEKMSRDLENPTGFVVTESRITEDIILVENEKTDQKTDYRVSGSSFPVDEMKNKNRDIQNIEKVVTEVKIENTEDLTKEDKGKTLPLGSRFKRRKPAPSFGTPRPNKTNEIVSDRTNLLEKTTSDIKAADNQSFVKFDANNRRTEDGTKPDEDCQKSDRKLTSSRLKPRFTPNLSRMKRTKTENDELVSFDKSTALSDVKVAAALSFEKTSSVKYEEETAEVDVTKNQKQHKELGSMESLEDENVHKLENEEEVVFSFTKPGKAGRFQPSVTSSRTKEVASTISRIKEKDAIQSASEVNVAENEKQKRIKNEEGKTEVIKTPRRSRFKPNVAPRSNRNDTKKAGSVKATSFEMEKEGCSTEEEVTTDETDFAKSSGRKVRFMPENDEEFSKNKDSNSNDLSKLEDTEHEVKSTKAILSRSYSDTEDGSQSEGEGIHHHSKRKFAPFLGPSVRQRRRLSSMTMSEDEGHMSDKNMQDKTKINSEVSEGGSAINKALEIVIENDAKAVSRAEPKKQKRKRIVINEPKDKMTMFDYIYYNPKGTEAEEAEREVEKDQEKKRQKRLHEESTRVDESEIVLGDHDQSALVGASNNVDGVKDDKDDKDDNDDGDDIIAPQIKIGEDGQIMIDEQSLTLKTTRSKFSLEGSEIVYNDDFDPYWRRREPKRKKRWPVEDTLKFYRVLGRVGTDFSLMTQFFPACTRRVLKKKFKTEEKFNGDLIDRALKNMLPMDEALFAELQQNKEKIVYDTNTFTGAQKGRRAANNKAKKEGQDTKEKQIVREEIENMEVAENVTL